MYLQVGWRMADCVRRDYYFIMKHVQMNLKKKSNISYHDFIEIPNSFC